MFTIAQGREKSSILPIVELGKQPVCTVFRMWRRWRAEPSVLYNSRFGANLLRKVEAAHQVFVAGIRAEGVERGIADANQEFVVSICVGFLQVLKRLVAVSEKRRGDGCSGRASVPCNRRIS